MVKDKTGDNQSTWQKIWKSITKENRTLKYASKKIFKSPDKMPWNIYESKTLGESAEKFNTVHYRFKYKFLVPLLWIARKLIGKFCNMEIEDVPHNKNVLLFDKAFEISIRDFVNVYMTRKDLITGEAHPDLVEENMRSSSVKLLRTMKDIVLTMVKNDTAYKEFMAMLMHSIAHVMMDEYKGQTVKHLIYNKKSTFDTEYVVMFDKLRDEAIRNAREKERLESEGTETTGEDVKVGSKDNEGKGR